MSEAKNTQEQEGVNVDFSSLSPTEKVATIDVKELPNLLFEFRWNTPDDTEGIAAVVAHLTEERVKEIYATEKRATAIFGRLYSSFGKVAVTEEQTAYLVGLADFIVDLVEPENQNFSHISLLAHNLTNIAPEAYRKFLFKVVTNVDLIEQVKVPMNRGFLPFIKQLKNVAIEEGERDMLALARHISNMVFELPLAEVLEKYNLFELNRVLWELLQIDSERLRRWIMTIDSSAWIEKLNSEPNKDAIFRLCWVIHQIDFRLSKNLAGIVWRNNYGMRRRFKVKVSDVPLLGYLMFAHRFRFKGNLPQLHHLASYISSKNYTLSHIAFCVFYINQVNRRQIRKFNSLLSQISYTKNPQYSWQNLVDSYPLQRSKRMLFKALGGFRLPTEPSGTFTQMDKILLYSDVALTELSKEKAFNLFYSDRNNRALFRDEDVAEVYVGLYFKERGWLLKSESEVRAERGETDETPRPRKRLVKKSDKQANETTPETETSEPTPQNELDATTEVSTEETTAAVTEEAEVTTVDTTKSEEQKIDLLEKEEKEKEAPEEEEEQVIEETETPEEGEDTADKE